MIGATLKSHFCLIAIPYWSGPPALMLLQSMCSAAYVIVGSSGIDLGQSNVALGQIPHQIINARRYLSSPLERCGASESRCDGRRDRIHMRPVNQDKPVARPGVWTRGIVGDRFGKDGIALDQMHGDDSV